MTLKRKQNTHLECQWNDWKIELDSERKKGPGLSCLLWKGFGHPALNEYVQKVEDPSLFLCTTCPVNAIHKRIDTLIFQNDIAIVPFLYVSMLSPLEFYNQCNHEKICQTVLRVYMLYGKHYFYWESENYFALYFKPMIFWLGSS